MIFPKRMLATALVVLGLVGVAGCGGGSSDKSSDTTVATDATTTTLPMATTLTPTTVEGADPDSAYCKAVQRLHDDGSLGSETIGQEGGPERLQSALDELAGLAPESVSGSIRTVAEALAEIADANPQTRDEMAELNQRMTSAEITDASKEFETYTLEQCGVAVGR